MAQLHGLHRGIDTLRPTDDVDMVLHVETTRGVVAEAGRALESLGYELVPPIGHRTQVAHRFKRAGSTVDVLTSPADVVDVLIADHPAPKVVETLQGHRMVPIEGGTQALKRTVNARLEIVSGRITTVSVPSPFGAVILKSAAYQVDHRDKDRHLLDAAILLATVEDPYAERAGFTGSDQKRIHVLVEALPDEAGPWRVVREPWRTNGQTALRILSA